MNMLTTFFAALHHKWVKSPSLKLSVCMIIDDMKMMQIHK
jgi:hypothetical protein